MKLLIASANLHKILEIKTMLKNMCPSLDIYSLRDFKDYESPEEIYSTFSENAELKALTAAKHFGFLAIADDSGLVVPALDDKPGVLSARYAGENTTDKENLEKLLDAMKDFSGDKRNAHYHCTFSLATPEKVIKSVSGTCEGRIVEKSKGANGFGYDPVFIKHDYNSTFAEIHEDIKSKISHRRKAFDKLQLTLEETFNCTT